MQAKISKLSAEMEELRTLKRQLESSVKSLQSELDSSNNQKEELSVKIVEKERQVKEVTSHAQTVKISYEKHQKEMSEKLERSAMENENLKEMELALEEERRRVDELQVRKSNFLYI